MRTIDRETSALLVVDFQARLMPAIEGGAAAVANARRLLAAADMLGVPALLALVHKPADGRGAAAIAVVHAVRCDTGMPSLLIRLSTGQATLASVFWAGRVRARRPRPMMVLYRNTALSPSERLP